jgi:hypothetical protein
MPGKATTVAKPSEDNSKELIDKLVVKSLVEDNPYGIISIKKYTGLLDVLIPLKLVQFNGSYGSWFSKAIEIILSGLRTEAVTLPTKLPESEVAYQYIQQIRARLNIIDRILDKKYLFEFDDLIKRIGTLVYREKLESLEKEPTLNLETLTDTIYNESVMKIRASKSARPKPGIVGQTQLSNKGESFSKRLGRSLDNIR